MGLSFSRPAGKASSETFWAIDVDRDGGRGAATKSARSGSGVTDELGPRVNVGRTGGILGPQLLGRHPGHGADPSAGASDARAIGQVRDPEVDHPGPIRGKDHVRGFEVSVDDPCGVD